MATDPAGIVVATVLSLEYDPEGLADRARIHGIEHDRPVRIAKGDVFDLSSRRFVAGDADRAGQQESAGLAQHVVIEFRLRPQLCPGR